MRAGEGSVSPFWEGHLLAQGQRLSPRGFLFMSERWQQPKRPAQLCFIDFIKIPGIRIQFLFIVDRKSVV